MVLASNTHLHMVLTSSTNIFMDFSAVSDHLDLSFARCKLHSLRPGVFVAGTTRTPTSSFSKE